jgi:hypothetical protein
MKDVCCVLLFFFLLNECMKDVCCVLLFFFLLNECMKDVCCVFYFVTFHSVFFISVVRAVVGVAACRPHVALLEPILLHEAQHAWRGGGAKGGRGMFWNFVGTWAATHRAAYMCVSVRANMSPGKVDATESEGSACARPLSFIYF